MKQSDFDAIVNMNASHHRYLVIVTSNGGTRKLATEKKSWFGRFIMWLGFSHGSLSKIAHYILSQPHFVDIDNKLYNAFKSKYSKRFIFCNKDILSCINLFENQKQQKTNRYKANGQVLEFIKKRINTPKYLPEDPSVFFEIPNLHKEVKDKEMLRKIAEERYRGDPVSEAAFDQSIADKTFSSKLKNLGNDSTLR